MAVTQNTWPRIEAAFTEVKGLLEMEAKRAREQRESIMAEVRSLLRGQDNMYRADQIMRRQIEDWGRNALRLHTATERRLAVLENGLHPPTADEPATSGQTRPVSRARRTTPWRQTTIRCAKCGRPAEATMSQCGCKTCLSCIASNTAREDDGIRYPCPIHKVGLAISSYFRRARLEFI